MCLWWDGQVEGTLKWHIYFLFCNLYPTLRFGLDFIIVYCIIYTRAHFFSLISRFVFLLCEATNSDSQWDNHFYRIRKCVLLYKSWRAHTMRLRNCLHCVHLRVCACVCVCMRKRMYCSRPTLQYLSFRMRHLNSIVYYYNGDGTNLV